MRYEYHVGNEEDLSMKHRVGQLINTTFLVALLFSLSACEQVLQKHDAKLMADATAANRNGDYVAALNLYEAALDDSKDAANTHFLMAIICETKIHDPLSALFHFRRCEHIDPSGPHAAEAKKSAARLEALVVSSLSKENMLSKTDAVILKNENNGLRKQIVQLKAQLAAMPRPVIERTAKNIAPDPDLVKKLGGRTYTVEPGDTLAAISRKVYKSKSRIKDIEDANINNLADPKKLQVGQVLIIPE